MKSTYLIWGGGTSPGDFIAECLGATSHHVYYGQQGRMLQAPVRYGVQAVQTTRALLAERPDVVLVQNPPIFAALIAYLYSRRYSANYFIDSHSAAFVSPKWRWSLPLHRLLSRGAIATLVSNEHFARIVNSWGCRAFAIGFTPVRYPAGEPLAIDGAYKVAVVNTGAEDEPLDVVFGAAAGLPDVSFYVTGDARRIDPLLLGRRPDNCHLTGYLPVDQYAGLLRAVDAVLDLTTRDHTLLHGAYEAVSMGIPLITSDWPILRSYFSRGTVHVANTVEGLQAGVRLARREQATLRRDVIVLREELYAEWEQKIKELRRLVELER